MKTIAGARRQRLGRGQRERDAMARQDGLGGPAAERTRARTVGQTRGRTGSRALPRRAAGDQRRIVARHVADRERDHGCRAGRHGQAPALDGGEAPADRVDFADGGAGVQQAPRDRLLVVQRQAGRRQGQQRRAATRYQRQHQVVRTQVCDRSEDGTRRGLAIGIGYWVAGLQHGDAPRRHRVAVARDDHARQRDVRPRLVHDLCHQRGGLARADHDAAPARTGRQCGRQHHARVGGAQGRVKEGAQEGAGIRHGWEGIVQGWGRWAIPPKPPVICWSEAL